MELKYIAKKEDIGLTINQILQSKLKNIKQITSTNYKWKTYYL